jgi:Na+-translocating ferredoxin:NAD+ oxidoreductase RnfD subunit
MTQAQAQPASSPAGRFASAQIAGLFVPIMAGIIAFGWRALICVLLVTGGTAAGWLAWRCVGRRGRHLNLSHMIWLGLLLSAMLPAHLAGGRSFDSDAATFVDLWPALPAAGLLLAALTWLLGGATGGRISPALICYLLLLVTLGGSALMPHLVLRSERAVLGDLLEYRREAAAELAVRPWIVRTPTYTSDATWQLPAADRLAIYTVGLDQPERRQFTLESLIRDRMPPMEDLIVLGQPAPIGLCSAAAVISGGLFLIFRGISDARIPVLSLCAAYLTLVVAPVPAAITREGPVWTWLPGLGGASGFGTEWPWIRLGTVGWDVGLTFVHYELLAGPILFIAFFLAPLPSLRPLARHWRITYALLLGPLMALSQLYGSVAFGPFIALLAVSLLTPTMDRFTRARTIV